jgi:hypothetical protein
MFGWILTFILLMLTATGSAINGQLGSLFGLTSSVVFGLLVIVSALTLVLRSRA